MMTSMCLSLMLNALCLVHRLDLAQQVVLQATYALHLKDRLRVHWPGRKSVAGSDFGSRLHV